MSNERIDLDQEVLREKLYDWKTNDYEPQMAIPDDLPNEITEILYCIEYLGLLAELKKCYEELDKWTNYATYIENVDMDCHMDASAEAGFLWKCTDCGARFELPEDGIYECEFGCNASE